MLGCLSRPWKGTAGKSGSWNDNPDEFDLAIIEPRMPEMMGVDLAIALKAHPARLPAPPLRRIS